MYAIVKGEGAEYLRAYDGIDMARAEISLEIERQRQIINECNSQTATYFSQEGKQ